MLRTIYNLTAKAQRTQRIYAKTWRPWRLGGEKELWFAHQHLKGRPSKN